MKNKQQQEIERLWNEIFILQAENNVLKRKLGDGNRDFSFYRNFCNLEKVAVNDRLIGTFLIKIEDLPFSTRTLNILKKAQIDCLGDIVRYQLLDIIKFRNMGEKSISEIKSIIQAHDLSMGMAVDEITKQALINAGLL